jgi:hypothetical protein
MPEFSAPPSQAAAVKGQPAVAESAVAARTWLWGEGGGETMHPFWAVRRLTRKQLAKAVAEQQELQAKDPSDTQPQLRFNCVIERQALSGVNVGLMHKQLLNLTRTFDVPFIVNNEDLKQGEVLVLELHEPAAKEKKRKGIAGVIKLTKQQKS